MLRTKFAAWTIAGMAIASAGPAQAVSILTMTEYSSDTLGVVISFPEVPAPNPANTIPAFSFSGNVVTPINDNWSFGTMSPYLIPGVPYDGTTTNVPYVLWHEPNSSTEYNLLRFHADGNQGYSNFEVWSDLTLAAIAPLVSGLTCRAGGSVVACPVLNNGDSFEFEATRLQPGFGTFVSIGTLRVTFDDRADIAAVQTPLPAALPLFATGLAGLGFLAHRRRKRVA